MKTHLLPDGRRLAWKEAGSGPPLLLLHGWSGSATVFAEAISVFADKFRLLVPDLRGHGASDPGSGFALADFAGDLALWLDALEVGQAAAVGWSMGGQVLLELASGPAGGRLDRLVLVGTTPRFTGSADWSGGLPDGQVRAMARDLRRNYLRTMGDFFALQFAGEELAPARYRRIVDFAVRQGHLPPPEVALAALETLRLEDQRSRVARIGRPALVVHGGLDRIVPPAAGRWLADQLPGGRLALLPQAGHAPFLSRPEEVFPLWRDFLHA